MAYHLSFLCQKKRTSILICLILILASFLYGPIFNHGEVGKNYFSPLTRCWEFMAGTLLAILEYHGISIAKPSDRDKLNTAITTISGVFLLSSIFIFSARAEYPGYATLLPVIGAMLFIIADSDNIIKKTLCPRPVIFIGLISYPLYLLHWPILSFLTIISAGDITYSAKITALCTSFILAALVYILIEKKIRNCRQYNIKSWLLSFCIAVCGGAGLVIYTNNGIANRKVNTISEEYSKVTDVYDFFDYKKMLRYGLCHSILLNEQINNGCISPDSIFIFGDSYAAALYNGLQHSLDSHHARIPISQMTDGNDPPFFTKNLMTDSKKDLATANEQRLAQVQASKPKVVLLAWMIHGQNAIHDKHSTILALKYTVERIQKASPTSKIIVIGPVPEWHGTLLRQLIIYYEKYKVEPPVYLQDGLREDIREWDNHLRIEVPKLGVKYISAYRAMCNKDGCRTRVGNGPRNITAVDWGHLTPTGSIFLFDHIYDDIVD